MNLRSAAICLDCDEVIDLSTSRNAEEETCPKCGSKDNAMLSKYIQPMPVVRVVVKATTKKKRCRKAVQKEVHYLKAPANF
jgi:hypothetical protein